MFLNVSAWRYEATCDEMQLVIILKFKVGSCWEEDDEEAS